MPSVLLDLGIPANRLRVRGYVDSREDLKQLFCEVDLALMPSRTEGFGLTGLEALSAGLPVIVSQNSGFGEALGQCAMWVFICHRLMKIPVHGLQPSNGHLEQRQRVSTG